jgi:hypothetical protein
VTELLEERIDINDSLKKKGDFESILAEMNTEAKTNVSYDVMNRYVRLYNAHRRNETFLDGKKTISPKMTEIRNRMKHLVAETPELIPLWELPRESNRFIGFGPDITPTEKENETNKNTL